MKPEMNRLVTSRKIWGAILGSIAILIAVRITASEHIGNTVTVLSVLWGAAIAGQAARDYIENKRQE